MTFLLYGIPGYELTFDPIKKLKLPCSFWLTTSVKRQMKYVALLICVDLSVERACIRDKHHWNLLRPMTQLQAYVLLLILLAFAVCSPGLSKPSKQAIGEVRKNGSLSIPCLLPLEGGQIGLRGRGNQTNGSNIGGRGGPPFEIPFQSDSKI